MGNDLLNVANSAKQPWYQFSVGISTAEVVKHLGIWLAETETADSLKCK